MVSGLALAGCGSYSVSDAVNAVAGVPQQCRCHAAVGHLVNAKCAKFNSVQALNQLH